MKKTLTLAFFLIFTYNIGFSQIFRIDSLPADGIMLDKGWKWHAGDNPNWAKSNFNDSKWDTISPTHSFALLPQVTEAELSWFRLSMNVDSSLINQPFIIDVSPFGALEIYLNGKLVRTIGKVSKDPNLEVAFCSDYNPINFILTRPGKNVIAVRYSLTKSNLYYSHQIPFGLIFRRLDGFVETTAKMLWMMVFNYSFMSGLLLMMCILHAFFFYFYPQQKANLSFSIALFAQLINFFAINVLFGSAIELSLVNTLWATKFISNFFGLFILTAVYQYLQHRRSPIFWLIAILYILYLLVAVWNKFDFDWDGNVTYSIIIVTFLNYMSVSYKAMQKGNHSAKFIFYGGGIFFIIVLSILLYLNFIWSPSILIGTMPLYFSFFLILTTLGFLSIPLSISLALARDFAQTSFSLQRNLEEVKQLSEEKQQILAAQNETLEKQVEQRTAELKASQNQLIQKEKLASLGELTAGIAHEIQNPLNFVNNFSELSVELAQELKEEVEKPELDKELISDLVSDLTQNQEKINLHGKRASSIVKGMLEHSRTGTGERQLTDINQLADEYLRLAYHGLRAKDNSFQVDYELMADENLPKINVVPQEIGQVLLNLINNAFYAVNERTKLKEAGYQPKVTVTIKTAGSQSDRRAVEIFVQDNGTGMSKVTKAKIFQPFFTTKPTGEGTGLGLSLAYDIVTKGHGGEIEVKSVEGEGTTFVVKLPI